MNLSAKNLKSELWDTLKQVKSGDMHVKTANAVSSAAANIIQVVKTEIQIQKMEIGLNSSIKGFIEDATKQRRKSKKK